MATIVLFKLGAYTGAAPYAGAGEAAVVPLQPAQPQAPTGFARWLSALEFELAPPKEIAIVGGPSTALRSAQDDAQPLLDVVFGEYRPNQVGVYAVTEDASAIPLLEGRAVIS